MHAHAAFLELQNPLVVSAGSELCSWDESWTWTGDATDINLSECVK